jgi:hypothetical protein
MLNLKLIMGSRLNKISSTMVFTLKAISKLRKAKIRNLSTTMNRFKTHQL